MNHEQITSSTQDLLVSAMQYARQKENPALTTLHVLHSALQDEFCISFFHALNVQTDNLQRLVDFEMSKLPSSKGSQLVMDSALDDFIASAKRKTEKMGDDYLSLEHILLEFATTKQLPEDIRAYFKQQQFTESRILERMKALRKGKKVDSKSAEKQYQILDKYCINLTKRATEGKLDPVIGRHEEIRRVIQILSRRTKNNPVLIGEPGVGKTAIVEGIAQRIINNDVPETLQGKQIYSLDLGLLIAGAKYQGEFEERLKGILKEVEGDDHNVIMFIDELHMLIGAGSSGGGMDASNLLKPALARGTLHCIGATTLKEYKKYIEKDAALERRFQPVLVEEPTIEDAISIMRGLKERYELHHHIRIKDQALINAVLLSAKYIPDRFLPDKAIDLIDEAASMVKMSMNAQPENIDKLERKIRQLEIEKVALTKEKDDPASKERLDHISKELANLKEEHRKLAALWAAEKEPLEKLNKLKDEIERAKIEFARAERDSNYAKASEIKFGVLPKLEQQVEEIQKKLKSLDTHLIKQQVDEEDVAVVLSRWTKIPAEKLQASESEKLIQMPELLKKRVVGQEEAIEKISHAIQMHRVGIVDPNRPIGSFLFLGPTGVGKTEVAKTLADFLFNDPNRMIRIDMSEYMEKHSVARLIGSPPGYVGYEEGGQLTEQIRRHPYSVVLFDEIEKAHPDVFNIFLQILDEGHLTDGQGRTISFKNTIIIMTSNSGSDIILEAKELTDKVKSEVMKIVHRSFRPEFLNRIDDIVFFKSLNEDAVREIAKIQIEILQNRMQERGIELKITDKVVAEIAERGYVKEFGARPLKRAIQSYLMVPLAQYILKHPDVKKIVLNYSHDKFTVQ